MRTLVYIALGAALLVLAMFLSGPTIKAHGTAWRATHTPISASMRPARNWSARI